VVSGLTVSERQWGMAILVILAFIGLAMAGLSG
jgi:cytochrome c oxidase cbb3-type subunit 1